MLNRLFSISLIFMILTSCNRDRSSADLIVENAVIYTADSGFTVYSAMAVSKGKVLALGDTRYIRDNFKADTIINAEGKAVYPGFIDAHCHFYGYALQKQYADLRPATSFDDMLKIIEKHHRDYPSAWLTGRGWDQNKWPVKSFPDNSELNRLYPDIPVLLTRIDGHAVLVNDATIRLSGLTPDSITDKKAAHIRDGKFTGIFMESYADFFRQMVPVPAGKELTTLMKEAAGDCYGVGLTMLADAGLDANVIDFIDSLHSENELKMAVYAMISPNDENIERFLKKGIRVKPKLSIRSVKMYADGALGSRGACLLKPYSDDPGNYGIMTVTPEELGRICLMAYDRGFQVNTHAIGDSAVRTVLNVYSNYLLPGNDLRWRVEHAQIVDPGDMGKFGEFAIIPSVQSTHATSDMGWAGQRIGKTRLQNAYAYRKLLQENGWMPNGTDFPIEDISPLYTFYAAVARKDLKGNPPAGFQRENALEREEALRSITIWAAKGCFEENRRGSLEPGKNADFVILDNDIMTAPEKDIPSTKVVATYIDGVSVFSR